MTFRIVRHEHALDYLLVGWALCAPLGPPHEHHAVLLRWPCACKCVEPVRADP